VQHVDMADGMSDVPGDSRKLRKRELLVHFGLKAGPPRWLPPVRPLRSAGFNNGYWPRPIVTVSKLMLF
jgi:hypothetical protein